MNQPELFVGVVVIRHDTVLLVKQEDRWQVPSGQVVRGEALQQAAEAVVLTMTGLTVRADKPVYHFDFIQCDESNKVVQHRLVINLAAEFVSGEFPLGREGDVAWVSIEAMEFMGIDNSSLVLLEEIGFLVLEE